MELHESSYLLVKITGPVERWKRVLYVVREARFGKAVQCIQLLPVRQV